MAAGFTAIININYTGFKEASIAHKNERPYTDGETNWLRAFQDAQGKERLS